MKCGDQHPSFRSIRCVKETGHDGDHVFRKTGRPSRHWPPHVGQMTFPIVKPDR
jgi:hypothetical protein